MPTDQPYVMQRGDTLEAVVAKIYGDAAQLRAIIDYNNSPSVAQRRGGRLGTGQRVLPGDVIYLPTKRPTLSDVASSTASAVAHELQGAVKAKVQGAVNAQIQSAQSALVATVNKANPLVSLRAVSPEPALLTAEAIRAGAILPADFYKFMDSTLKLPAAVIKKLQSATGEARQLSRPFSDPAEALSAFYGAYRAYKAGRYRDAFSGICTGVSSAWPFLPEAVRKSLTDIMARLIAQMPILVRVSDIIKDMDDGDATGSLLKMVSGILEGDKARMDQGGDELCTHLKDHPALAAKVALDIFLFLTDLLPDAVKAELGIKAVGRKIPVVGTIAVGIFDLADAIIHPTDWKKWASVGSTAVGIIPGAGTAVSTVIDITVVLGTIGENIHSLVAMEFRGSLLAV